MRKEKRRPGIDLDDAVPFFFTDLFQRLANLALHAAGVVYQDMHSAFSRENARSTKAKTAARSRTFTTSISHLPPASLAKLPGF